MVDVGLAQVIKREEGLAPAFSEPLVERVNFPIKSIRAGAPPL